jgi:hypothetical protein
LTTADKPLELALLDYEAVNPPLLVVTNTVGGSGETASHGHGLRGEESRDGEVVVVRVVGDESGGWVMRVVGDESGGWVMRVVGDESGG